MEVLKKEVSTYSFVPLRGELLMGNKLRGQRVSLGNFILLRAFCSHSREGNPKNLKGLGFGIYLGGKKFQGLKEAPWANWT